MSRRWRERNEVTLQETADLLGISVSYLSRIERGERTISDPIEQVKIARRLKARVRELFPQPEAVHVG